MTEGAEGDPPDNFSIVMAAKYWGVAPWVMMHQPVYWLYAADDYAIAERHKEQVKAQKQERARARGQR